MVASDVRAALTDDLQNSGIEETFGASNRLRITTSYLANDESTEADQKVEQAVKSIKGRAAGQT